MSFNNSVEPVVLAQFDSLSVLAFECSTDVNRVHAQASIAYLRSGSMSYRPWGNGFDMTPGSMLIGRPDVEYYCAHDTGASGKGLSFRFSKELIDATGYEQIPVRCEYLPPVAELIILGELAQSAVDGNADIGLDEIGVLLAHRLAFVAKNYKERRRVSFSVRHRKQIMDIALWLETESASVIDLRAMAGRAGMSSYHFLKVFTYVIGVTPHQYLIRCRLRQAAKRLADSAAPVTEIAMDVGFSDLSNFVKAFHRAAGMPPLRFRELAQGKSKRI